MRRRILKLGPVPGDGTDAPDRSPGRPRVASGRAGGPTAGAGRLIRRSGGDRTGTGRRGRVSGAGATRPGDGGVHAIGLQQVGDVLGTGVASDMPREIPATMNGVIESAPIQKVSNRPST